MEKNKSVHLQVFIKLLFMIPIKVKTNTIIKLNTHT